MKKKTFALFILLFAAFFGLQTGMSAAESHVEEEDVAVEEAMMEDEIVVEVTAVEVEEELSLEALKEKQISELTDEERTFVLQELAGQLAAIQEAVDALTLIVAQVVEARTATFAEAPTPVSIPVAMEADPVPAEDIEVIDASGEEDLLASIQSEEEEVDVDALFAGTDIDAGNSQGGEDGRLLAALGNPENRGAFVLIAAFIVGGILFALSRRKKGPKPVPAAAEQKVEPQPSTPTLDQAPWG